MPTTRERFAVSDTGFLQDADFVNSPDHGGPIMPEAIVLHYTAGAGAAGSTDWLSRKDEVYVSAHVVIARSGLITQLVPFNLRAFHAGRSSWKGRSSLNNWSIGIELANAGHTEGPKEAKTVFFDHIGVGLPAFSCLYLPHKNNDNRSRWWELYSSRQIDSCVALCQALVKRYPAIREIVGHDDVAPDRKTDPGPALDLDEIRLRVYSSGSPVIPVTKPKPSIVSRLLGTPPK